MEKENVAIQRAYKKATNKTSLLQKEKKSSKLRSIKKLSNKFRKEFEEFDDMGSLIFLKNGTKRKKLNGIDERIKLLKTELKSLLGNKRLDKDCNFLASNKNEGVCANLINVDEINQVAPKLIDLDHEKSLEFCKEAVLSDVNDFKPSTSSVPSKFSEWLNKTIDEMDSKPECEERNLINSVNIPLNSKLQLNSAETSPSLASDFKSKFFNISLLPQDKIERLLYKTFVMQNSEIYLSSSEDSGQECKSVSKTKQQKYRRSRKSRKSHKERLVQSNLSKNCGFSQKRRKGRLISRNSFLNEIEVIDLDNSLNNNSLDNKEMVIDQYQNQTDCEILDVDNYDWNEPFDIDEDTKFLSDVELTDHNKKNDVKLNNQDLKLSGTEMLEREQNVSYNEESKAQQKRVWECPVCFEQSKGQEVVATQCGHIFCRNCIENHSTKLGKSCPSCRSDLKDKPLITLFNF